MLKVVFVIVLSVRRRLCDSTGTGCWEVSLSVIALVVSVERCLCDSTGGEC